LLVHVFVHSVNARLFRSLSTAFVTVVETFAIREITRVPPTPIADHFRSEYVSVANRRVVTALACPFDVGHCFGFWSSAISASA
jgi:hypothetical protein